MPQGLLIAVGLVLLVGVLLVLQVRLLRAATRRSIERRRAELESEGVVLDSGLCRVSTRFRLYRRRAMSAGAAIGFGPGRLVLTRANLHMLGVHDAEPVPYGDLRRCQVGVDGGKLLLATDEPGSARGRVEVRFSVEDPDAWLRTLLDAGCPPATA